MTTPTTRMPNCSLVNISLLTNDRNYPSRTIPDTKCPPTTPFIRFRSSSQHDVLPITINPHLSAIIVVTTLVRSRHSLDHDTTPIPALIGAHFSIGHNAPLRAHYSSALIVTLLKWSPIPIITPSAHNTYPTTPLPPMETTILGLSYSQRFDVGLVRMDIMVLNAINAPYTINETHFDLYEGIRVHCACAAIGFDRTGSNTPITMAIDTKNIGMKAVTWQTHIPKPIEWIVVPRSRLAVDLRQYRQCGVRACVRVRVPGNIGTGEYRNPRICRGDWG